MAYSDRTQFLETLAHSALELATHGSWQDVTLSDVCESSGRPLCECAQFRITLADVADQLDRGLDQAMLKSQSKVDKSQSVRDRLFDTLMGRFDAMEDNRAAWISILTGERSDPFAKLARGARRARAGAWALEASGVSASDMRGKGQAIGLARIIGLVEKTWLDDGGDLAKTMARLDQLLRDAENWTKQTQDFEHMVKGFRFGAKSRAGKVDRADSDDASNSVTD